MLRLFRYTEQIKFPVIGDPKNAPAKLLFQLKRLLLEERASDVQRTDNILFFAGGFFRLVSNWNMLAGIGKGKLEVTVEERQLVVSYQLSFLQLVLGCTAITAFFAVVLLPFPIDIFTKGIIIASIWLLFFGVNIALALYRFPKLIMHAWKKAFHIDDESFWGQWYR